MADVIKKFRGSSKFISMKGFKYYFILILFLTFIPNNGFAQCTFDPVVTGDTMLCPNAIGVLTTQNYDTYQWYKRAFPSGTAIPVSGGISQTLTIDAANDAGYYFKVEATLNGCTEMSPEVLVDGWLFLPPYTIIEGNYTIGGNGEIVICQDDTLFLISGLPYNNNLQWYNNGNPIPGSNNDTLEVTSAGSFTFSGAPQVCPGYLQNQFIPVDVVEITCPSGLIEAPGYEVTILPNPASDLVTISFPGCERIEIYDAAGKQVLSALTNPVLRSHEIKIDELLPGYFTVWIYSKTTSKAGILLKSKGR